MKIKLNHNYPISQRQRGDTSFSNEIFSQNQSWQIVKSTFIHAKTPKPKLHRWSMLLLKT